MENLNKQCLPDTIRNFFLPKPLIIGPNCVKSKLEAELL